MGDVQLAERLFTAALNLAEGRRGGLFVVLDEGHMVEKLLLANDLLGLAGRALEDHTPYAKEQLHYLLRQKRVLDIAPAILETLAALMAPLS